MPQFHAFAAASSRVALVGLSASPHLNGKVGKLGKYDGESLRWEVDVDGVGFKKIKEENLKPPVVPSSRRRRLCKYGDGCYRPECWYQHESAHERCRLFASTWTGMLNSSLGEHIGGEMCPQASVPSQAMCLGEEIKALTADVTSMGDRLQASALEITQLKQSMASVVDRHDDLGADTRLELIQPDLDDVLAAKQRLDDRDSVVMVDTSFKPDPAIAIDDSRLTSAELAIDELTGLCAFKDVELDNRMEEVERKVDELSRLRCHLDSTVSELATAVANIPSQGESATAERNQGMKFIQRCEMNDLILGTLQAAMEPMASVVARKLEDFDKRLSLAGVT